MQVTSYLCSDLQTCNKGLKWNNLAANYKGGDMLKHISTWLDIMPSDVSRLVLSCLMMTSVLTWMLALKVIRFLIVSLFLLSDGRIVGVQALSIVRQISQGIELGEQPIILIIALASILFWFSIWTHLCTGLYYRAFNCRECKAPFKVFCIFFYAYRKVS